MLLNQLVVAYTGADDALQAGARFEDFGPTDTGKLPPLQHISLRTLPPMRLTIANSPITAICLFAKAKINELRNGEFPFRMAQRKSFSERPSCPQRRASRVQRAPLYARETPARQAPDLVKPLPSLYVTVKPIL